MGRIARQDKEVVAEPVEVAKHQRLDEELFVLQADAASFGAAADAAGDMGGRNGDMPVEP